MKVNGKINNTWHKQFRLEQNNRVIELKSEYLNWITKTHWDIEFTLNRHCNWYKKQAISAAGYFGQCLDKSLYGNARRRFGKSFERVMCLEYAAPDPRRIPSYIKNTAEYGNWHIHGVAKIPADGRANFYETKRIIERSWNYVLEYKFNNNAKANYNVGVYNKIEQLYGYDYNEDILSHNKICETSVWLRYATKQLTETGDIFLLSASHINVLPV